jgi:membrane dipeptidase
VHPVTSLIVDAHLDIAHNAVDYGRKFMRSAYWTRAHEDGLDRLKHTGECTVGLPELIRGRVGLVFGTIWVAPKSHSIGPDLPTYTTAQEAHALGMRQFDWYHRIAEAHPTRVKLVTDQRALKNVCDAWETHTPGTVHPLGIVPLMEGADPILEPKELERWVERGLRIVGPAWDSTRYAGGTWQKGRLSTLGRELLDVMARFGVILDVAHLSQQSLFEALDAFEGQHVIASHCNPARFVPNVAERHLPDAAIERIAERNGVIGVVLYNRFLVKDWQGSKREGTLDHVIRMIDHICQVTGSANHVGIGSDYDGGLGREQIPNELDSIRDHHKIGRELLARGYTPAQVAQIMRDNWLALLRRALP